MDPIMDSVNYAMTMNQGGLSISEVIFYGEERVVIHVEYYTEDTLSYLIRVLEERAPDVAYTFMFGSGGYGYRAFVRKFPDVCITIPIEYTKA